MTEGPRAGAAESETRYSGRILRKTESNAESLSTDISQALSLEDPGVTGTQRGGLPVLSGLAREHGGSAFPGLSHPLALAPF